MKPEVAATLDAVVQALRGRRRILLSGPPGAGKSTLAQRLGGVLSHGHEAVYCLSADPGSPPFGVPGAVCLGRWDHGAWRLEGMEALCSLNAARFRLPLVAAMERLLRTIPPATLVVDPPGVVRGVAAAELLTATAEAVSAEVVLVLGGAAGVVTLEQELAALGLPVLRIPRDPRARRPGLRQRLRERTMLWDRYLERATAQRIELGRWHLTGTPPPLDVPEAWTGRQVALLSRGRTRAMGEVVAVEGDRLELRAPSLPADADTLLVRDAARDESGFLTTLEPFAEGCTEPIDVLPEGLASPAKVETPRPLALRVGHVEANLVNGVFGDPCLHLRLVHQGRRLLFDLGEGARLPARVAHRLTDVFVSHAHFDHIAGFLWLLRARIGLTEPCRLYGPPGLADHLAGFLRGILWDRIGDRGPRFIVTEWDGALRYVFQLQAGRDGPVALRTAPDASGVLLDEPGFRVRAALLDHHTPVLAFALEPAREINVRKDRLAARGLEAGPWLGELKRRIHADALGARITLPTGVMERVGDLARDLVLIRPGKRLVYATDLADTPDNRGRLERLAHRAHTLFCEAAFVRADRAQARRTGHLTARACGEIAAAAGVARLVPFHFSRRYENDPARVYREVIGAFPRVVLTPELSDASAPA